MQKYDFGISKIYTILYKLKALLRYFRFTEENFKELFFVWILPEKAPTF